jgi:type I phosphodiesterase/nucleotide pyrophosphatase
MSAGGAGRAPKLVLAVIDGLRPAALQVAMQDGTAPALAALAERGVYRDDLVSEFPSLTPVCTASIATGVGPDRHFIPAMNWFLRAEGRYVEYGSSLQASRAVGLGRSLTDLIYNLNLAHLSRSVPTVFESLDDAGVRTAGTTFLIYRGRYRHEAAGETALARLVTSTLFRHAVYGPRELFYADMFASRDTGCRSQLGLPGARDDHAGCVGAFMVREDLFDFLLLSLPDNDSFSHQAGPERQVESIVTADRQLQRLLEASGGPDSFLEEHAIIVLADHSHSAIERRVPALGALDQLRLLTPSDLRPDEAEVAFCPGWRSAMLYVLQPDRAGELADAAERAARKMEGADLVLSLRDGEAIVWSPRGELRFAPDGDLEDMRGDRWSVEGGLSALEARTEDGRFVSDAYPEALWRIWSALSCENAGEVIVSAAPGYEFTDWGGIDHVGGGSHGSLHREDSLGSFICAGIGPAAGDERERWTLRDIAPLVEQHFGLG